MFFTIGLGLAMQLRHRITRRLQAFLRHKAMSRISDFRRGMADWAAYCESPPAATKSNGAAEAQQLASDQSLV
jgi:hypothetical protein